MMFVFWVITMIYSKSGLSLEVDNNTLTIRMDKHKTFLHIFRYISTYYNTNVKIYDSNSNVIVFKNNSIDVFISNYKLPYVEFGYIIEDASTYNQFISVFKDSFYLTKYENIVYPIINKSRDGFYLGVEFEVDIGDKKLQELIPKIKKEYLNFMIAKTELDDDYNIVEFCIFPMPINKIGLLIDIIKNIYENISNKSDRNNIHMHVSKEYFGKNNDSIIDNLKKVVYFDSSINDVVKEMLQYAYSNDTSSLTIVNKFNCDLRYYYDKKREEYENNTNIRYYMHINIYKLLHRVFNVNTIEFKWLVLSRENYNNLELYMYLFLYYLSIPFINDNEITSLTYDDFIRWYNDQKNRYTN